MSDAAAPETTAAPEEPIPGRCGARTRSHGRERGALGQYCRQWPITGARRCKLHGGIIDTRNRPHAPHLKHGLYSKVLDPELREDYEAAVASVQADNGVGVVESGVGVRLAALKRYLKNHPNGPENPDEREAFYRCLRGVDEGVLVRKSLLEERPADTAFSLTIAQPGSTSITVRTAAGPAVALKAPDGSLLLDDGRGNWVRAISREVDGVEVWSALVLGDGADRG